MEKRIWQEEKRKAKMETGELKAIPDDSVGVEIKLWLRIPFGNSSRRQFIYKAGVMLIKITIIV